MYAFVALPRARIKRRKQTLGSVAVNDCFIRGHFYTSVVILIPSSLFCPFFFLPPTLVFSVISLNLLLNIHLFLILSIPIIGRAGFLLLIYLFFFTHAHTFSLLTYSPRNTKTHLSLCMCVYNICAHVVDYLHQPLMCTPKKS